MSTLKVTVDMTKCIYQPLSDWIKHVEEKYSKAVADECKRILGEKIIKENLLVHEMKTDLSEVLKKALENIINNDS
ncbi:MAG: hypothetical protein WC666_01695 [Candidatus Paceibacterota bacterium]|jgi:hypothetical protein